MLRNRAREALRIGRRLQEIRRLHDAVIGIKRHDNGVGRVAAGDDGDVGVFHDFVEDAFEIVPRFGEIDDVEYGGEPFKMCRIWDMSSSDLMNLQVCSLSQNNTRSSLSLKVERRARKGFEAECFESQARGGRRSGSGEVLVLGVLCHFCEH